MVFSLAFLRRRKDKNKDPDKPESKELEHIDYKELFYRQIYLLLYRLVIAYTTNPLKWYEMLMLMVAGVFFGIGLGVMVYGLIAPVEKVMVIEGNVTRIIKLPR